MTNGHVATPQQQPFSVPPPPSVTFLPEQISALRAQISAFKLLSRGQPVPDYILQSMQVQNTVLSELEKLAHPPDVPSRIVDSAVKAAKGEAAPETLPLPSSTSEDVKVEDVDNSQFSSADLPKGPFLEDNVNSGIYPYNAYRHPFSHLKRTPDMDPTLYATRLQRLLIPTIMPAGLDAHQILGERERYLEARIQQRIRELESLPSTLGDGAFETTQMKNEDEEDVNLGLKALIHPNPTTHGKLRAVIELKSLRVLDKQRALRALVAERLNHGTMLPLNRIDFRRTRKPTLRDARATEQAERRQRVDRELRAKHKHVEQLEIICNHAREMLVANRGAQDRITRLNRAVLSFHVHTEKEEQKRVERISKERLKALKADDEEAYLKLIDTAKDTRITHLLRQTDAYLDSLAQAVVAQQNEHGLPDTSGFEQEEGPTSEATFGAQVQRDETEKVDYYAVAHKISERVTKQPALLIGGTLKEYQLKGLQWMVSLYNNRLNGILADEMVSLSNYSSKKSQPLCFTGSRKDHPDNLARCFLD